MISKSGIIFSADDYVGWSGISVGQKYKTGILDSVKKNIAFHLSEFGYLNSTFSNSDIQFSSDSQNVKIFLQVNEGEPTYIHKLFYSDADSLDYEKIIPLFDFLQGQIFRPSEIEASINEALTFYENNGYPFAKIVISSIYFFDDSTNGNHEADIYLDFKKENKSTIDTIEVIGNVNTKDYVIKRELRIKLGEKYSQKVIEELPKRLNRLRFFEPVGTPEYFINSKEQGVLLVNVKEKQTNNFDGIIGYIPGNKPDEKGYLTGLVNVSMRNLFGTGRGAAIRWQQLERLSQELELKYLEPWVFGFPFNLNGSFFQRKQDTTFVQRKIEGSIEYLATEDISASLFIGSEQVIPTVLEKPVFTIYNSSSLTTGVNLKIDTRDDPYAPTEGLLLLNSYSFSTKRIYGPTIFITPNLATKINLQRITIDFSFFYELFKRQIIAAGLHARELRGPFFEESDLFRLGGATTLRGYRENQFLGSRTFWSNFEYRLLLTRRTYAFGFFDTGYYLRNAEISRGITKSQGFKIGYGVGLNIETGLGVLSVSFALAKGDTFAKGKIHFGLVNEF